MATTDASLLDAPAPAGLTAARVAELDQLVAHAVDAAAAFRRLDQIEVDRIVHAMVVAGLEHAVELALLAVDETGFGVIEDKVVKNYVATEFLYDYLRDQRSAGVIDEDPEAGLEWVAEPVGVVMADDDCIVPMADWQPRDAVLRMAADNGWSVRRIKIDDGCYEIDGRDAEGRRIEVTVSPDSLQVIEIEYKDDDERAQRDRSGNPGGGDDD